MSPFPPIDTPHPQSFTPQQAPIAPMSVSIGYANMHAYKSFGCSHLLIFRSVLFNFHIFLNFPSFLLLIIFSFILLCLEKDNWNYFNIPKFVMTCFMTYYMIIWRVFHRHLRRMCILLLLDGIFCQVYLAKAMDQVQYFLVQYFLSR